MTQSGTISTCPSSKCNKTLPHYQQSTKNCIKKKLQSPSSSIPMVEGAVVGRKGLIESCPAAGCLQRASAYRFVLGQANRDRFEHYFNSMTKSNTFHIIEKNVER